MRWTKGKEKFVELYFDSVEEMLDKCDDCYDEGRRYGYTNTGTKPSPSNSSWIGRSFKDWKDVRDKANKVWEEGVKILDEVMSELAHIELPPSKVIRRKRKFSSDGGDDVCIDRLRSGQDYWMSSHREETAGCPIVTIVSSLGTSAFRNTKDAFYRGAAAIIIAEILENAGFRTEIFMMNKCSHVYGTKSFVLTCKLKDAKQHTDRLTMVNALSGWYYRTVKFQSTLIPGNPNDGLGRPQILSPADEHVKKVTDKGKSIVIDDVWNRDACVNRIKAAIEEIKK